MGKLVKKINALEADYEGLSDLRDVTAKLRERLEAGEALDSLLPDAFAAVREASKRTMEKRHFDVQLVGGITLHEGRIAEMRTGEGKTLMATLPAYLNALSGEGVHVVTVNDYLARRDSEWMGPIFEALGMTVGVVTSRQDPTEKRAAYRCDITYGTNNEFGFDYLRDNMAFTVEDQFQRGQNFAVVGTMNSLEQRLEDVRTAMDVAVIGCIVNGPGEAREADVGLTGATPNNLIYVDGEPDHKISNEEFIDHLEEVIRDKAAKLEQQRAEDAEKLILKTSA